MSSSTTDTASRPSSELIATPVVGNILTTYVQSVNSSFLSDTMIKHLLLKGCSVLFSIIASISPAVDLGRLFPGLYHTADAIVAVSCLSIPFCRPLSLAISAYSGIYMVGGACFLPSRCLRHCTSAAGIHRSQGIKLASLLRIVPDC